MHLESKFGSCLREPPNKEVKKEDVDSGWQIRDKRCTGTKEENSLVEVPAKKYRKIFLCRLSCSAGSRKILKENNIICDFV